jgi:hypothetical protein
MVCDLTYEHFQNMQVEIIHKDKFSQIVYRVPIWNQQENISGHFNKSMYFVIRK